MPEIVKLSDLSEEDRRKALQRTQDEINERTNLINQIRSNGANNNKLNNVNIKAVAPIKLNKEEQKTKEQIEKQIKLVSKAGVNTNNTLRRK